MTEDTAAAVSETDPSDPSTPQRPVETSTLQDSTGSSGQSRPRLKAWPLSLEAELHTPIHCNNCKGWVLTVGGFLDHVLGPGGSGNSCFLAIHDPMPRCEMPRFVYRNLCKKWGFTKKMDEYITAELTPFLAKRIPEWKEWRRQDDLEIAAAEALAQKEAEERAEARRARNREDRRKRRLEYNAKYKYKGIHSSGWSNEAIAKRRKELIDRSQKSAEVSKKLLKARESGSSYKQERVACSICGGVLSKDSLRKHLAVVHPAEWEPGSRARSRSQPNSVEIKVPKSECPICETSVRRYDLKSHIQENHPEDFSQERWDAGEEKRKKEKALIRQMILLDTFGYELPSGKRNYCPVCDKSWSRLSSLKDHLQRVHPDDFSQELWDRGLQKRIMKDSQNQSKIVLIKNNKKPHRLPRADCPICKLPVSCQHLRDHIKRIHPDDFSQEKWDNGLKKRKLATEAQTTGCLICGLTLSSLGNLKRHIKSMHSEMEVPMSNCPICEESVRRFDLKSHIQNSHPEDFSQEKWDEGDDKRKAEKAKYRSKKDQKALRQLGKLQFKKRRIYCPICDRSFSSAVSQRLKDHIFKEHPDDFCQEVWDKGHPRPEESKTTDGRASRSNNEKSCESPKSDCPICKLPVSRTHLKQHLERKHPEDFSQELWDKGLQKRKLKHIQNRSTLNNNKPPKGARTDCPICKLPVSRHHLKDHLKRIHPDDFNEEKWNNGIKKRKLETTAKTGCPVCGAMISPSNLSRHIKSRHSDESSTTTFTSGGRGAVGLKKDSSDTQVDFCLKCHAETTDLAKHVKRAHKNETRLEKLPFLKRNLRIASKYKSI